jgi:putative acetyltransferase
MVARRSGPGLGEAVGIGALWVRADRSFGEVKRMYVPAAARGLGVGRRLLQRIEEEARREQLAWLRLETGTLSHEALRLYEAGGFRRCGPFADYPDHPMSVFMEKPLR